MNGRNVDTLGKFQAAVKYGTKARAHSGRDGSPRWRFTYQDMVFITDESCRHEITSWRKDDAEEEEGENQVVDGGIKSHVIIVVDSSGSMRKTDVPGYSSRTEAVYSCLIREFVAPQLKLVESNVGQALVTLIEMGEDANVVFEKHRIEEALLNDLYSRANTRGESHGNYIPTLKKVHQILQKDKNQNMQIFLLFLSDGAPSDHIFMKCKHKVDVWQIDPNRTDLYRGKPRLKDCSGLARNCRQNIIESVNNECVSIIRKCGQFVGYDRMHVHTVAFGSPSEDYIVLERMASVLPKSSFQKLGLAASSLRSALTSLTSSFTSLRTEGDLHVGKKMTLRAVEESAELKDALRSDIIRLESGWELYVGDHIGGKSTYDDQMKAFKEMKMHPGAVGIAVTTKSFAKGCERLAFRCTEIAPRSLCYINGLQSRPELTGMACVVQSRLVSNRINVFVIELGLNLSVLEDKLVYSLPPGVVVLSGLRQRSDLNGIASIVLESDLPGGRSKVKVLHNSSIISVRKENILEGSALIHMAGAKAVGPWMVGKEAKYEEQLRDVSFQQKIVIAQCKAEALAKTFNGRIKGPPEWQLSFVVSCIYEIRSVGEKGHYYLLAEPELNGKFLKWNNNNGVVKNYANTNLYRKPEHRYPDGLDAIAEEDEEEEEDDEEVRPDSRLGAAQEAELDMIPQCFSHFTWSVTDGRKLVCDLQGVWNAVDGFVLTDPVIHSAGNGHKYGRTDKGDSGIMNFFQTHRCSKLCVRLGLKRPSSDIHEDIYRQQHQFVRDYYPPVFGGWAEPEELSDDEFGETDFGESDYGESDYGESFYGESVFGYGRRNTFY